MEERKNVYLSLHKSFVREGIEYTDRATGEARTFNSATLPKGTVVDGVDVGGYEFSPMFVNESRFKGADFRDIPLLANREVWLRKTVMGPDGQPELDEGGRAVKDTVKVMPAQLKEAVDAGRSRYLAERAEHARQASRAARMSAMAHRRSFSCRVQSFAAFIFPPPYLSTLRWARGASCSAARLAWRACSARSAR